MKLIAGLDKVVDEPGAARPYRMTTRLDAVASTRERILRAAYEMWLERPYDQVSVEAVAETAGVSRQTVVRQFGTKDELAVAVVDWQRPTEEASRAAEPGDVPTAVSRLIDRYETMGDANVRMLELEGRVPAIDYLLKQGRESHRAWIERIFVAPGPRLPRAERERVVLALYAATDVTVWKLLRRDLGQSRSDVEQIIRRLVDGVLGAVVVSTKENNK
jgi:AcrR family transcriptional regulator